MPGLFRHASLAALLVALLPGSALQPPCAGQPPGYPAYRPYSPAVPPPPPQTQGQAQSYQPPRGPAGPTVNPGQYAPQVYSPGYGYPVYQTPANGYLTGVADVTNANAQYQVTIQQARQASQQVEQTKLQTRRQQLELKQYEQSITPTLQDMREKEQMDSLRYSRNNPPQMAVWTGAALNDLFGAIQNGQRMGIQAPPVPLDQDMLKHINLTIGTTYAGAGMLKHLTEFEWPLVLNDTPFDKGREEVERLARMAVQQASSGGVAPRTVRDLNAAVAGMEKDVKAKVEDLTPTQYVQGMRYLRELKESFKVLQDPNVGNYFNGKYRAQGATVADLVQYMSGQGLRFAAACAGDEPAYSALYQALLSYDYRMSQASAR